MKEGHSPAGGDLVGEIFHILERDQHDDGLRMGLGESPGGFETVHLGHEDVHEHQIGALLVGVPERLHGRRSISGRLKPGRRTYNGPGSPAKNRLVIDDHHRDAGGSVHLSPNLCPGDAVRLAPSVAHDNRAVRWPAGRWRPALRDAHTV